MATEALREARAALIVATWDYQDVRFRRLRSPSHDAERLADLLADASIGAFDVEVVRNQGVLDVKKRIEAFLKTRGRNDLTLLYFSGHGVLDERNSYFIAASDTEMDHLAATGIDPGFLNRLMVECRARCKVLFLDTCHSGAFAKDLGSKGADQPKVAAGFSGSGSLVISASGPLEPAFEGQNDEAGDPSVFTAALVRGLETGEADQDGNALVTVDELYDYLCDEVTGQQPQRSGHEAGRIVISSVPADRRKPAPLPSDIERAMDSEDVHARLGVVVRLQTLLASEDPTVAAAARLGLARMKEDDSRRVSDNATAALAREEPRPVAALEVHSSQVPPPPPPPPPPPGNAVTGERMPIESSGAQTPAEVSRNEPAAESVGPPAHVDTALGARSPPSSPIGAPPQGGKFKNWLKGWKDMLPHEPVEKSFVLPGDPTTWLHRCRSALDAGNFQEVKESGPNELTASQDKWALYMGKLTVKVSLEADHLTRMTTTVKIWTDTGKVYLLKRDPAETMFERFQKHLGVQLS